MIRGSRIIALVALSVSLIDVPAQARSRIVVVYYPEWRIGRGGYGVKQIEQSGSGKKIDVLNYAFCEPAPDSSGQIQPAFMNAYEAYQQIYSAKMSVDGIADDSTQPLRGQFNQLRKLKAMYPKLKVLISIGGWSGSTYISDALVDGKSRERFADEIIDRFIHGNLPVVNGAGGTGAASGLFDGVDIDWEYPLNGGDIGIHHDKDDNKHLSLFYQLLRKKFDSINPDLLITAAVPAGDRYAANYDLGEDQNYLNWYNLMSYDYIGSWDSKTGNHTNLLTPPDAPPDMRWSLDASVKLFENSYGVKADKIAAGVAFYGHGWKGVDSTNGGLYDSAAGPAQPLDTNGFDYYSSLRKLSSPKYEYIWDTEAMAPRLYNPSDKTLWTYDDPKSVSLKVHYVDAYGLRGIMCWEITGDDSAGTLLNTMYTGNMPDHSPPSQEKSVQVPEVKIISPRPADTLVAGSSVILNTETSQTVGKVEFFVDDKSIGYDTCPPFDWVWFNIGVGRHVLEARAIDNSGNIGKSKSLTIDVVTR